MTDDDLALLDRRNGVAILSFNRPEKHNATNNALVRRWWELFLTALGDDEVRVVLLRGEGRSFSSGRDTSELGRRDPGDSDFAFVRRAQQRALTRLESPKPIVAALKGYVLGGAFETALTADIRVADSTAVMALPEIRHGIMPDTGGVTLTTKLAGSSRAKYLAMTGDRITAAQALDWGLVDILVEPAELDDRTLALCERIAHGRPEALAMIKQTAETSESGSVRAGFAAELFGQTALFATRPPREE
ncbi:enoyl-CoA hydratase/isomerase family protein [Microbacterium sp. No. 7]|uniref:enoyl-CoA hydratase/isomerase family protein n=1 Tax=Microbacterium sp. No. 7 TaxID=1714373 RepID=UPI0006D0997A|nr:enoyl-CoA hydratase/isomerase family protein [Microbacterium sp. No. 7]ALJ18845.1 hypothetical protein AOA12_02530 [Microbacterium sp. No. 7]